MGMAQVMRYCQPDGSCGMNSKPNCKGIETNIYSSVKYEDNLFKYESLRNVIILKYYLFQDVRTIFITVGVSRTHVMILLLILQTRLFSCGSRTFARKLVEFVKQVRRKSYLRYWTNIYFFCNGIDYVKFITNINFIQVPHHSHQQAQRRNLQVME